MAHGTPLPFTAWWTRGGAARRSWPQGSSIVGIKVVAILIGVLSLAQPALAADLQLTDDSCTSSVELMGDLQPGDSVRFGQLITRIQSKRAKNGAACKLWTVFLDSKGGSTNEALLIGRRIRQLEAETFVRRGAVCASACAFVLAGGVERGVEGRVGIHRPYFSSLSPALTSAEVRTIRDRMTDSIRTYLADMDIAATLLDAMLAVPPEEMRWLSAAALSSYRLTGTDPTYDERNTAWHADYYGITSAEYRRREANMLSRCTQTTYDQFKNCREPFLWNLPPTTYQARKDKMEATCGALSDRNAKDSCRRRIMLGG